MDDSRDLQTWNEGVPVKGYAVTLMVDSFVQLFKGSWSYVLDHYEFQE